MAQIIGTRIGQPLAPISSEYQAVGRTMRRPKHDFYVRHRPHAIQPFLLAPVIPGETMKQGLLQARAVTYPVSNPLIGWHLEYYFFYVKHRDLLERDTLTAWTLDPSTSMAATEITAASGTAVHYTAAGQIRWTHMCLKRIVDEYFRDEGEAWNIVTIDGLPAAKFNKNGWTDSLNLESALDAIAGDLPDDADAANMGDLDKLQQYYEFLKGMKLTSMTYEDFLKSYGVRGALAEDPHKPELLRYVREWTYPSNTIDPATGAPSSACSWSIADRIDKDRFFPEPGFIFGVTVCRPKVYFRNQSGSAAGSMNHPFHWLPAVMHNDAWSSLVTETGAAGQAPTIATNYVWDARDLLMYGDQFLSDDLGVPPEEANLLSYPTSIGEARFPSKASLLDLFVDATDTTAGKNYIRQDGTVQLHILGRQQDRT